MNIKVAADRGDRLLIEVDANRGQRARVVAVPARGDAAHVDHVGPRRAARLERDRRQLLGIALEIRDVELFKLGRTERLDRDRHVLEVFRTFLRGHHDFVGIGLSGFLGQSRHGSQRGGSKQQCTRCAANSKCHGHPIQ